MTTLRVIIDQIVAPVPGGIGRYALSLTRQLIATKPRGADVAGIVSASPEADYAEIHRRLPGLSELYKSALARRELAAAWQHGFTVLPGVGMVHATSLLAPLRRHDRHGPAGHQTVVTIHDAVPWTHPETLTPRGVSWHKAMARRAEKYADAIVVPTHAVAAELSELLDFGDRLRVIGGAVSADLTLPDDADERAASLELPDRYVLSVGTLEPRKNLADLIAAFEFGIPDDVHLVVVGPPGWGELDVADIARQSGLAEHRLRILGKLDDAALAVVYSRAAVFAFPSLAEGFGLPLLEAFALGVPVVHSDIPALSEVADGAGLAVPVADRARMPQRLAEAIGEVLNDPDLADKMTVRGRDRAKAYTWRDSAEKVWQLHADL